ncbi:MAG TPA: single-stranded-DNA-specific exonuclease RecJ [Saprospirales bacterium]|nr:single-stranded-DNA-specific exonuclease RecJ [Saprospirales bacterium]
MKPTVWKLIPTDDTEAERLHAELKIPLLFCKLLLQRGIRTREDASIFFRHDLSNTHNPFLMKDMDKAVERLDHALQSGERILLYGDYDVDGTTSVALMYAFLSGFYANLDYYLPNRDKEGYGVSIQGVEYARETGCTLIIAMDCGIKAHKAIDLAKGYGIDFIVCDHHLPEGGVPDAVACLDPKREDCGYPYKELSGCGVSFKLAQGFALQHNMPSEELASLLDLVAVSTACDIVHMTGENRIFAHFGMQRLNRSPRIGLWAIAQKTNRPYPLDISDVVFGIGPMINAAGRLADAREAVRLLLSVDKNSALDYAGQLVQRNKDRRQMDQSTAEAAQHLFKMKSDWQTRKSTVLFDPNWHKGIIGIVASRMVEAFHKPTVILTESNGKAVGSARSVAGFDLYSALQECEDLFYTFGGHAHAAGVQLPLENIEAFEERFEQVVGRTILPEIENPQMDVSAVLRLEEVNADFWKMLKRFEPFGPHNNNPLFWAKSVFNSGKSRLLENNHVKLSLQQEGSNVVCNGIGFGLGKKYEAVEGGPFDILFHIREEEWQGYRSLGLYVKDIRKSSA